MANVTVTVSGELKQDMDSFEDINWSAVARKAFAEKIGLLKKMDTLLKHSELTERDAVALGRKVNKAMWEKHYKQAVK